MFTRDQKRKQDLREFQKLAAAEFAKQNKGTAMKISGLSLFAKPIAVKTSFPKKTLQNWNKQFKTL
jgi:hypothetical protein